MEEFVAEWILDDIAHKFDSKQFRVTKGASKICTSLVCFKNWNL